MNWLHIVEDIPTGSGDDVVTAYFEYLYQNALQHLQQNYYIHWDTIGWVALWLFILAGGFFAYTRWQRTTHAAREPYPVESYNGYIQEGNGPVGVFLSFFLVGMVIWLVAMTVSNLSLGQIY